MNKKQKYQAKYYKNNKEKAKKQTAQWYRDNKEKAQSYHYKYYRKNKNKIKNRSRRRYLRKRDNPAFKKLIKIKNAKYREAHPEYISIRSHYDLIVGKHEKIKCYYKMPFFDKWNPEKGGSFHVAEDWVIKNIGKRPDKNCHLHIIDRQIGFMPENLAWVPKDKHRQEEMVNKVLLENKRLREQLNRLKKRA